jgi:MFS family permease
MVSSSQGGSLGDGLVILATLGCAIAYAYKIFINWLAPYLKLSIKEIHISAHLHWTASAIFLLSASFLNPSKTGGAIGAVITTALAAYAIAQGKRSPLAPITKQDLEESELWIYIGITTAIGAIAYLLFFAFPNPWLIANLLQPYAAAIACIIAAILYLPDWEEWGWSEQPWHNSAFGLPLVFIFITQTAIATPCLLIVGIFYLIYAKVNEQIRVTYIAVFLWDWAIFQNVSQTQYVFSSLKFLINICVIGFSGLYFAQVEPNLQSPHTKALRHTLRSLLSGGMGLFAFIYSFNSPSIAIVTWGLSFAFIIAGLAFRVRAYLFMGTLTFVLLVITQAVTLVSQYSFLMWALGIVAGIGFILVAANFEVRRDRILALFRNVAIELETWD